MTTAAERVGLAGTLGLALGSGGAKGWAHIGVIRALEAAGIQPEIICGTSMGAVVGAAYGAGKLEEFEAWARQLEWRGMMKLMDLNARGGILSGRSVGDFFEEHVPGMQIQELHKGFAAVATDLATGREVWLREGSLVDALSASVAVPGLIAPARHEGRWLVDGGLVNPVPVSLCRVLGADAVIAVDLNTTLLGRRLVDREPDEPSLPAAEAGDAEDADASQARWAVAFREMASDVRERLGLGSNDASDEAPNIFDVMANAVNIMQVRIGRSRMSGDPPELLIAPRISDYSLLDFDRAGEAIEAGRSATENALRVSGEV